ncbi:hypothetical protein NDU88_004640 [Pleurodeles waltl]|uniref:Uncharacterized protein n=1 Tax=Pleurodeles waltl TaxID=8319 RepID=A0AAV7VJI5_PLEWA|nr:hypothetical protein NDU88_004640 [Pleurodeles waltl]
MATTPVASFRLFSGHPGPCRCCPVCARCLLTYLADVQSWFFLWSLATSLTRLALSAVVPLQSAPFVRPARCCVLTRRCPGGAPSRCPTRSVSFALCQQGAQPARAATISHRSPSALSQSGTGPHLTAPVWHAFRRCKQRSPPASTSSQSPGPVCRSDPDSRVCRLRAERSCPAGLLTVCATVFLRCAIAALVAPRGQETVPSHYNDRPIRDLHLRPQVGHFKKEKLEARMELRFTRPPCWPG